MDLHTKTTGIVIGVPDCGRPTCVSWAMAMACQSFPVNTKLIWVHVLGETIADARNRIVEEAKKANAKYLWFVDTDTVPSQDTARHLMYLLDQNGPLLGGKVMVAGGIYCVKHNPPTPLVFAGPNDGPFWNWKVGDVFKCWGLGTGCMMINMEIFNHISEPYFKTTSEVNIQETDDLYFCQKVEDVGFEVMAHGGLLCTHWDVEKNIIYSLPSNSYPMLPREKVIEASA